MSYLGANVKGKIQGFWLSGFKNPSKKTLSLNVNLRKKRRNYRLIFFQNQAPSKLPQ